MNVEQFKQTIKFAIENEVEAEKFYKAAADRFTDQNIKDIFLELATEERGHRNTLKEIYSSTSIDNYFDATKDYHVSSTIAKPEVSEHMKPADAIALAMKKEEEAMTQYKNMADACPDPEMKNILIKLSVMEQNHKFKLENAFVDIGYPEIW
jgi:rubrerythrin